MPTYAMDASNPSRPRIRKKKLFVFLDKQIFFLDERHSEVDCSISFNGIAMSV